LFEISEYNLTVLTETLYFCNYEGVFFDGNSYLTIPCEAEGYDLIGQGTEPNPTLTVKNTGRVISDFLYTCKYTSGYRIENAKVKRRLTELQYLDGQLNAHAAIREFTPFIYRIEQIPEETYEAVKFRLASPWDLEGATVPGRPALRSCPYVYRDPTTCAYAGSAKFNLNNAAVSTLAEDKCAHNLRACEKRGNEANYGGFPGLGGYNAT
jgi:lambda family phage minor tail protein L